jgi:hypothetical protein
MLWAQLAGIGANLALGVPMTVLWGAAGAAYAALVGSAMKGALSYTWYVAGVRRLLAESGEVAPLGAETHSPIISREVTWAVSNGAVLAEEAV